MRRDRPDMDPILLSLVALLFAVGLYHLLPLRLKRWKGLPYPPGPIGYPILGSLTSLDGKNPQVSLTELADKYGKDGMFSMELGSIFTVVLTDPKLIRQAFNKDIFSGRPPLYFTLGVLEGQGLISAAEDLWKDQRKMMTAWMRLLGAARGSETRPKFEARMVEQADQLEKSILKSSYECVNVHEIMALIMGNNVNQLVFGISYKEDDPVFKWLLQIQEEGVKSMGVAGVLNFLPFIRFLVPSMNKMQDVIKAGQAQTHRLVEEYVKIRKRRLVQEKKLDNKDFGPSNEIECHYYSVDPNIPSSKCTFKPFNLIVSDDDCILDYYLEEQEKRRLTGDEEGLERLSDKQLKFFLCDCFGAALDTSLNTTMWFLLYIAMHPEEQELIRKELREVCGDKPPALEHMAAASYTRAAICETQRIRSVVPIGIPHGTTADTTLGGYFIPKGSMILPLQWYLHNDPKVWDDPDSFKPSRFLDVDGTVLNPPNFMPFQAGKRMCPGDEFARMTLFIIIGRLVSRFEISLAEPIETMDGIMGITLCPPEFKLKMMPLKQK